MDTKTDLFSLWLLLPPSQSENMRAHINRLSTLAGSPSFEPHITIASDLSWEDCIAIEQKASTLAPSSTLSFGELTWGQSYFQSVYLPVCLPEPIAALRHEAFAKRGIRPDFPPHASVAYGVKKSAELEGAIAEVEKAFSGMRTPIGPFALVESSEDRPISQWRIIRTSGTSVRAKSRQKQFELNAGHQVEA